MNVTSAFNVPEPVSPVLVRLKGLLWAYLEWLQSAVARRERYRQTVFELSQCSERNLEDIGVARSDIRRIAHDVQVSQKPPLGDSRLFH